MQIDLTSQVALLNIGLSLSILTLAVVWYVIGKAPRGGRYRDDKDKKD